MTSVHFQGEPFNITVIQVCSPTSNAEEAEQFWEDLQDLLELTPKKGVLFIIAGWNAKVGSQVISGVTGQFGIGVQNEAEQQFCQENTCVIANTLFQHIRDDSTHGHHQVFNTEIRLIISFAAEDGEALYSLQKQDRELTVAKIMNSLLQNSDLN